MEPEPVDVTHAGDLALLVEGERKRFLFQLQTEGALHTHRGTLQHGEMIGVPWGSRVTSHLGRGFVLLQPTIYDLLLYIRRQSQIVFPKDIGYLLLRLSIGPGRRVAEAGAGSGAMTTALAWAVGPTGAVYSYDRRADMLSLASRNLDRVGLSSQVHFHERDIQEGFLETGLDAVFLDVPEPQHYLHQVRSALREGGTFGAIVPTANQVSSLVESLRQHTFGFLEVSEILLRTYKTIPARIRPDDRMVAHTGYLIFARPLQEPEAEPGIRPEHVMAERNEPPDEEFVQE
ncbi:MAG: tRNA (adenine-N1)-methyltransferase [Anaerolineales bacterium]